MATKLINCFYTPVQLAMDNALKSFITEGNDTYKDGIWRISSKFGTSNLKLITVSSSAINLNDGKVVMVSSEDVECTEDIRVNPLCDFGNSLFNSDKLVAWGDERIVADTSDSKHMRKYITTQENTDADDYANPVTYIADAGKGIGTFKNIFSSIDCIDNLASGVCCFQEFNLENAQCYGFHSNIDGLTGEYEVILSNDSAHCQARKNIRTGKLTYIEETDPVYNLVPSRYSQVVVLGDYFYYIGADEYIHKVNKTTLVEEAKGTTSYTYSVFNLFTDGTNLYISYLYTSKGNNKYAVVDTDDLTVGSYEYYYDTMPDFMKYSSSYPAMYCQLGSLGDGKLVLYSAYHKCAVVFTDLTNIKGSILAEYTQFNIGGSAYQLVSFALTSKGVYTFWTGNTPADIGTPSEYSLKVCKNTSGQLFNIAEWQTPFENSGSVQVELTLCE